MAFEDNDFDDFCPVDSMPIVDADYDDEDLDSDDDELDEADVEEECRGFYEEHAR